MFEKERNPDSITDLSVEGAKQKVEEVEEECGASDFKKFLQEVLASEREKENRKTLINWLEKKKKKYKKFGELEEKEGKFVLKIKGLDLFKEMPVGRERILHKEDLELPLVPIKGEKEVKGGGGKKISLKNVRNYVNLDFKSELKEREEKAKKEVIERSFIKRILGFKGEKKVIRSGESREFVINHLRSTKSFPEGIRIVALAFYLKEFLEVMLDIKEELSYKNLAEALESERIEESLKEELHSFFVRISNQIYKGRIAMDFQEAYQLAKKTMNRFLKVGED